MGAGSIQARMSSDGASGSIGMKHDDGDHRPITGASSRRCPSCGHDPDCNKPVGARMHCYNQLTNMRLVIVCS